MNNYVHYMQSEIIKKVKLSYDIYIIHLYVHNTCTYRERERVYIKSMKTVLHKPDSYLSQPLVNSPVPNGVSVWCPLPLYSRYIFLLAFIYMNLQCWKDYFFSAKVFNAQQIFMTPFMARKQNTRLRTFSVNQPLQNKWAVGKGEGQFNWWTSWSQRKSLILHVVTCWNMNPKLRFPWTLFNCLQQWCHLNMDM